METNDKKTEERSNIWFGQLKFQIIGGLTSGIDMTFTITPDRAALLEHKLLKAVDEFVTEA